MHQELDGKVRSTQVPPNAEEVKEFWSKEDAEWLKEVEFELENVNIQENVEITKEYEVN